VQYPGCGAFFQPASYVALDPGTGRLSGICLASLVHADVGHVTQVCVVPSARGTSIGYELIRRSLESLVRHGCKKVTLTVTAANTEAIVLYERMGFHKTRNFAAYVWDGFGPGA
jgi:ribosomal protein S18 acetylase RimI-like enzyme